MTKNETILVDALRDLLTVYLATVKTPIDIFVDKAQRAIAMAEKEG